MERTGLHAGHLRCGSLAVLGTLGCDLDNVGVGWDLDDGCGFRLVYLVMTIVGIGVVIFAQIGPAWVSVLVLIIGSVVGTAVALWVFFFFVGRVAYVPQVMLVEGKGIFASVSRSFSLARGNIRRLMAMTLFVSFAVYSALMILVVPLAWYAC